MLRQLYEQVAEQDSRKAGHTQATYFGEKSPEHQRRPELLRRLFPQAKVLLI
jgi:hypothetical protein